jgi:hypothetical protein
MKKIKMKSSQDMKLTRIVKKNELFCKSYKRDISEIENERYALDVLLIA